MLDNVMDIKSLPSAELLATLTMLVGNARRTLANILVYLAEVEDRGLFAEVACSSMFEFCLRKLGLSGGETHRRLKVARIARKYPQLLPPLASGQLLFSNIIILHDLFTDENVDDLIAAASYRTVRQVEEFIARLAPKPDVPSSIRKLPDVAIFARPTSSPLEAPRTSRVENVATAGLSGQTGPTARSGHVVEAAVDSRLDDSAIASTAVAVEATASDVWAVRSDRRGSEASSVTDGTDGAPAAALLAGATLVPRPRRSSPRTLTPLSEGRHRVMFTVNDEVRAKLERVLGLTRRQNPKGDIAIPFERALDLLIEKLEARQSGKLTRTRKAKRPDAAPQPSSEVNDAARDVAAHVGSNDESSDNARLSAAHVNPAPDAKAGRISQATRREVYARDGGQCTFVSASGERCGARDVLEFDHRTPRACGGTGEPANIRLLCRSHNAHAAVQFFGRGHIHRQIERRRQQSTSEPREQAKPSSRKARAASISS